MEELTEHASKDTPPYPPTTKEGEYKSVITINSEDVSYVNITSSDQEHKPDLPVAKADKEDDSIATDDTSTMSSSAAMYLAEKRSDDSDAEMESLPYTGHEGVVLLRKEDFPEFKQTPEVEITHVDMKDDDGNDMETWKNSKTFGNVEYSRDSVTSGDGVTAEEISFADEVMASIEAKEMDEESGTRPPPVTVEPRPEDARKKVLMPNFDDLSMDEEITFDFDHSDVMFVPPTPPTKDIAKEETKGEQFPEAIPEPIIEPSPELDVIHEQPPDNDPFDVSDGFYEDNAEVSATTANYKEPDRVFESDFPTPPPPLVANPYEDDSFTYTVTRDYNISNDINDVDDDDGDDGFKVPVLPPVKRKVDASPVVIAQEPEQAQVKSLRDAYRKPEKSEPETIIISKEKPLPVFQAKLVRELPVKRRISLATDKPRPDDHENEAAHRRISMTNPPVRVDPKEPTDGDRHKVSFWGPRPWNARANSEPSIKDVRMALTQAQVEEEYFDSDDVNHNQKGSQAREQCSQIGYEPALAEETDHMLEEKPISLSMTSLPVQVSRIDSDCEYSLTFNYSLPWLSTNERFMLRIVIVV